MVLDRVEQPGSLVCRVDRCGDGDALLTVDYASAVCDKAAGRVVDPVEVGGVLCLCQRRQGLEQLVVVIGVFDECCEVAEAVVGALVEIY